MLEIKVEETKLLSQEVNEIKTEEEATNAAAPEPPPPPPSPSPQPSEPTESTQQEQPQEPPSAQNDQQNNSEGTLNPLNEPENNADSESKTRHRRYWTPKEEEKLFQIWGRENWRLTKHGKNTIFFAKWAEEMKERFNIDVKPEEVQCKVNQTRAKFRQVKKMMDTNKQAVVTWKKYELVEKILKNQYRSKDDEPVPPEAIENNRDYSPTELLNCATQPCSPSSMSNIFNTPEQNINLSQPLNVDHQLTDEVNIINAANLSDQNLLNNNSLGNSFSTELFGSDHLDIKQEFIDEINTDGFSELSVNQPMDGITENTEQQQQPTQDNQAHINQLATQPSLPQQVPLTENTSNMEQVHMHSSTPNSLLIQNRSIPNHNSINATTAAVAAAAAAAATTAADGIVNLINHANGNSMQPPKTVMITPSPRKRNRSSNSAHLTAPLSSEALESLYLEEVKKKNVILVEQGEMNRKRLRLEERKVKLMEEFFPKFMNLQQDILKKLETLVTNETPKAINTNSQD